MTKEPPARPRDLAWFEDRSEIRHVIEVLRDAGEALRTPDLTPRQLKQLASIGVPLLRAILEHALLPWSSEPARAPNNFEEPVLRAFEMLANVRHAGELDERLLFKLEKLLTEAHTAWRDAKAVSRVLTNRSAGRAGARARMVTANELHKRIRQDARKLLAAGREMKDVRGILAIKHKRTPRQIRNILPKKKRK